MRTLKKFELIVDKQVYTFTDQYVTGEQVRSKVNLSRAFDMCVRKTHKDFNGLGDSEKIDLNDPGLIEIITYSKYANEG